jgi:hypothetical protein
LCEIPVWPSVVFELGYVTLCYSLRLNEDLSVAEQNPKLTKGGPVPCDSASFTYPSLSMSVQPGCWTPLLSKRVALVRQTKAHLHRRRSLWQAWCFSYIDQKSFMMSIQA